MTEKEALKLALEALEVAKLHIWLGDKKGVAANIKCHQTITAIKEALAQPEYQSTADKSKLEKAPAKGTLLAQPAVTESHKQEPLEYWNAVEGWVKIEEVRQHFDSVGCGTIYKTAGEGREPLYTTPPQRKPLPAHEIVTMYDESPTSDSDMIAFARAIEAAHGIGE